MCMIDGAETVDCLVTTYRKARKTHRCSECGRTIAPAERYRAFREEADVRQPR